AGDGLLIEQAGLHRCRPSRQGRPELGGRDARRVGTELLDRWVEPGPAQPARIDQHEVGTVGEPEREPGEPVVTLGPPPLPVVATVDLVTRAVTEDDPAGHAKVDAEHRPGL